MKSAKKRGQEKSKLRCPFSPWGLILGGVTFSTALGAGNTRPGFEICECYPLAASVPSGCLDGAHGSPMRMGSTPHLAAATSALAGPVLAKPLPQKRLRGKAQIASIWRAKRDRSVWVGSAPMNGRRSQGCRSKKLVESTPTAQSPMWSAACRVLVEPKAAWPQHNQWTPCHFGCGTSGSTQVESVGSPRYAQCTGTLSVGPPVSLPVKVRASGPPLSGQWKQWNALNREMTSKAPPRARTSHKISQRR